MLENHPDHIHVTVLQDENIVLGTMSYRDLQTAARAVAQGLISRDIVPGDRIAMMLPTSTDFFASFFGILYAGAVPVPIYPPARMAQLEEHMRRQIVILRNAGARMLITVPEGRKLAVLLRPPGRDAEIGRNRHDALCRALRACRCRALDDPEALGLMQYTSGCTGDPKGVMLTHWGLLENMRSMGHAMEASSTDMFVSWLPLYHDMGLIGAWLGCCYFGARLYVMSPISFLVRPATWLWTMHKYRATFSGGPNFAFELCASRIPTKDLQGLDLSALRFIVNGAEPISPQTLRQFHRALRALRHEHAACPRRATGWRRTASACASRRSGAVRRSTASSASRWPSAAMPSRPGRTIPTRSRWSPAAIRSRRTTCASSTMPATRSASARRACWNSAGPR